MVMIPMTGLNVVPGEIPVQSRVHLNVVSGDTSVTFPSTFKCGVRGYFRNSFVYIQVWCRMIFP